jgi:hypothetical protein
VLNQHCLIVELALAVEAPWFQINLLFLSTHCWTHKYIK